MKIALVLRGHYRSFDKTHIIWDNVLKGLDYDCYFHTWDLQDSTTPTWNRGEKYALELYPRNTELLKKYDANIVIEHQEFSNSDISNIYMTAPYKTYLYRYESLKDTLNRIPIDKYDIIIVGRYDLLLNEKGVKFDNLIISDNEILIGAARDDDYYKGLRCTDLLFAFKPKNIPLFEINPYDYELEFKNGEEPFTNFLFNNFKKVSVKWVYGSDFSIKR
jgi:hypothetical protein